MELKSWRDNPSVTLGRRESRIIFQAKKYLYVINLQFPWLSSFRLSSSKTAKCREVKIESDVHRNLTNKVLNCERSRPMLSATNVFQETHTECGSPLRLTMCVSARHFQFWLLYTWLSMKTTVWKTTITRTVHYYMQWDNTSFKDKGLYISWQALAPSEL